MTKLKENAAGGSMGGGSIAVRMDGESSGDPLDRMDKFMKSYYKRVKNCANFKPVKITELTESDNSLNSIVSRLKSSEHKSNEDVKKFAIEDERGNLVKISVPSAQANDIQHDIALQLGEIEEYKSSGYGGKNITIAELIFDLRKKYNIVDVIFPEIANDGVYKSRQPTPTNEDVEPADMEGVDDMEGMEGMDDMDGDDIKDKKGNLDDGEDLGDELSDADNVEDMRGGGDDEDVKSILNSVLDMMKKTAEAEKAKADAEAEKSRALQAKYTAMATKSEMAQQEDIISMEAEIDAQKAQEKEAKQMAELAKHKYMKTSGVSESYSFLRRALTEVDEFDNMQMLRRQKGQLRRQFTADSIGVDSTDDDVSDVDALDTNKYVQQQRVEAGREIESKIRQVRARDKYREQEKAKKERDKRKEEREAQQEQNAQNQSNNLRQD